MSRDIGPDMLAQLDRRLATGEIDGATYEARKTGILEMIRKGQAFTLSKSEKTLWSVVAAVFATMGLGFVITFLIVDGANPIGMLIGLAMVAYGFNRLLHVLRH